MPHKRGTDIGSTSDLSAINHLSRSAADMIANLLLHVHELPEGRVVVTPIDFPRLSVDADSYEAARKAVVARLDRVLKTNSDASIRSGLAMPESAELDSVDLELPEKVVGAGRPRITVSLVVTLRPTSHGELYVVKAPEIPDIEVAVTDRDDAVKVVKKALEEELTHWDLRYVLSCDLIGAARLESVEVRLPATTRSNSNDDDSFEIAEAAEDLTRLAQDDAAGHLDERDETLAAVAHALTSSGPSSVMLVGPPNVGKTALIHQLARLTAASAEDSALAGRTMLRLSANELIAGAKYTGMWQERARRLVELGRTDGTIFAMDDPMSIVDAGRWSGSDNNLSRVLRPFIESGQLTLICECTPEVYAAAKKSEPSFVKAFTRVDVAEPEPQVVGRIAEAEAGRIARRESIRIEPSAAPTAIELTTRFQPYLAQPGKAIRLIGEAAKRLGREDPDAALDRQAIIDEFATQTGLPLIVLSDEERFDRDEARAFFEERVLGQDDAVDAMVDLISVVKAGLSDPGKPLGVFFCIGPTGVGKTELTKALAEYLFGGRERMIRFDMGEFTSSDAVARLVGTKWSRDEEGELTGRVREQPFSVVLLDELEKANRSVYDVLLSVLGEGRLTDAGGRSADFRNAIIVMTSNLGADSSQTRVVGFNEADAASEAERLREHFVEQAQKYFKPEFYNRIDRVIAFRPLDRDTVRRIARRELGRLLDRQGIVSRQLLVEIDDAVVEAMAQTGFDPKYGARPLKRQIERSVIQPLARLIVEKRPGPGDLISLRMDGDTVNVELRKVAAAPRSKARAERASSPSDSAPAVRRIGSLHQAVASDELAELVERLRAERSQLVDRTNQPSFWDDSDLAKETLTRLYQIERVIERFDALFNRTSGLVELARQLDNNRDRGRQGELRQAVSEVEEEISVVRLELAGALMGPEQGAATVRVIPIGGSGDWADALMQMYVSWASRSGREAEMVADRSARIAGLSSYELLKAESGLHRHVGSESENLARVIVIADDAAGDSIDGDGLDRVVRVYSEGKNQFVRDQRTGVRIGDVASVFRGRIDEFLIGEATRTDPT